MSRVAIVTGSNKGIGFGIVRNLCNEFDGVVYLTSRNVQRGQEALERLNKEGLHPLFHQLDINDLRSIQTFRDFIKTKYSGIDCLVNNAAIAFKVAASEPFGVQAEETIKVNYFGTLNLCNTFFPLLKPHARVVNVSSSAGFLQRIPSKELQTKFASPNLTVQELTTLVNDFVLAAKDGSHLAKGWPNSCYCVSKVAVSALTRIQQKEFDRLSGNVIVNHVHPGYVDTDMTSHKGHLSIEQGAVAPTYAALLPRGIKHPKGDYIWFDKKLVDWVNGPLP